MCCVSPPIDTSLCYELQDFKSPDHFVSVALIWFSFLSLFSLFILTPFLHQSFLSCCAFSPFAAWWVFPSSTSMLLSRTFLELDLQTLSLSVPLWVYITSLTWTELRWTFRVQMCQQEKHKSLCSCRAATNNCRLTYLYLFFYFWLIMIIFFIFTTFFCLTCSNLHLYTCVLLLYADSMF